MVGIEIRQAFGIDNVSISNQYKNRRNYYNFGSYGNYFYHKVLSV